MKKLVIAMTAVLAAVSTAPSQPTLTLTPLGTLQTGGLRDEDPRIAEINAYDPTGQRVYVVNPEAGVLDVIDISTPGNPVKSSFRGHRGGLQPARWDRLIARLNPGASRTAWPSSAT